jgi:hypothetical protein
MSRICTLLYGVAVLLLAACASVQNTPAQDLAHERVEKCGHIPGVNITRVEPSGRVWATFQADNRMAFNAWNACMQKALADQRTTGKMAANAQPPIPQSEVVSLVKFAYFTDAPPAPGTFLHTTFGRNMPPDVKQFPAGKTVTFFYAINQVGRVLPVQARWIGPDGAVAASAEQTIDQTGSAGAWTWKTHTPKASEVAQLGRWEVELLIGGAPAGRYEFVRLP